MNKILLVIAVIAIIVIVAFFILPSTLVQYFWLNPLEEKRQHQQQQQQNFQNLCREWNTTGCSGQPSDELCKAAVENIATTFFPLDTEKCSEVSNEAIELLRTACCEK